MRALFEEAVTLLEAGHGFAMATLFGKTGSAPRTEGAKMLVRSDGSIAGTVGGGRLEADAIRAATEAIAARRTTIHGFDLTGSDAAGGDMICGGRGEILVDFVDPAVETNLAVYRAAVEAVAQRRRAWLVTAIGRAGTSRQQCLVRADGTLEGALDAEPSLLAKLIAGPARISLHAEAAQGPRFLVEPIRPAATVYVFGAGHVSRQIAPLAVTVGFRTVVLDDRPDFASRERFAPPIELVVLERFDPLPALAIDEDSYLVIVTRGHLHDASVLAQALRTKAAYIGMIGSRRKRDLLYRELLGRGFRQEDLARVHAPIGIEILADTPEEIAVSVVGELIRTRAERERTTS